MAKYQFKVYLQNGDTKTVVPKSMVETDLHDMDKFVYEQGSILELYKYLASELKISSSQIEKVTILRTKKEIEFTIISDNPYLTNVLSSLKNKKVFGHGNYLIDAVVVPMDNSNYIEMENYLFSNVQGDYNFFLNNVYTYDNEFAKLLYRYGNSYKQGMYQEEDERNIKNLEDKILIELSIYKNYRGLCLSRKKYEDKIKKNISYRKNTSKIKNLNTSSYINNLHTYTLDKESFSRQKEVEEYNQKYEEFLDEDEYAMMQDEDNDRKY